MLLKFKVRIELPVIRLVSILERLEQVLGAVRGGRRLTKYTHDFKDWPANLEVVLDDGNVNLYAHRILRLSPESLVLEMLLNPFEKQFHLPPVFIEERDVPGCKIEVVRVVDETALEFWGIIDNPSNNTRKLLFVLLLGEADALVFEHIACSVQNAFSICNLVGRLALLPDDEESPECVDAIESGKVRVASVKHIARQRLVCEPVHRNDIMYIGIGNSVEYRYLRNDVNLCVDPDIRLGASELCPSEYGHAEVDGSGIDGIEPAMQPKLLRDASGLGNGHHVESELLKDTVVSESNGLLQHLSVDRQVAQSEVFILLGMGGCYICELPEASAAHELAEHQNQRMVRHRPTCSYIVVLSQYPSELPLRDELYYLCRNEFPYMYICSDLESDVKVSIPKLGQGIRGLKRCA